eukprot:400584_1
MKVFGGIDPPQSRLVLAEICDTRNILKSAERHAFNHQMELFLPSSSQSTQLNDSKSKFYKIRAHPADLVSSTFVETYVKNGDFVALSLRTPIDHCNTMSFLPKGKLLLTLDKDSYQVLGLTGKPPSKRANHSRYTVTVDLVSPKYTPGSRIYERVQWCLSRDRVDEVELICMWLKDGISQNITFPKSVRVTQRSLEFSEHVFESLRQPQLSKFCSTNNVSSLATDSPNILSADTKVNSAVEFPGTESRDNNISCDVVKPDNVSDTEGDIKMSDVERPPTEEPLISGVSREGLSVNSQFGETEAPQSSSSCGVGPGESTSRSLSAKVNPEVQPGPTGEVKSRDTKHKPTKFRNTQLDLETESTMRELYDWLGLVSCRCEESLASLNDRSDEARTFISAFACPSLQIGAPGRALSHRWRGMIPSGAPSGKLAEARSLVDSGQVPWAALSVWGFPDSPVSWTPNEHTFTLSGDNGWTWIVLPGGRVWEIISFEDRQE